jgi:hypothetical protein
MRLDPLPSRGGAGTSEREGEAVGGTMGGTMGPASGGPLIGTGDPVTPVSLEDE